METNWTIGKGVGYGLKWIAIMGMVIAFFGFAQFLLRFQAGYYDREFCPKEYPPIIIDPRDENYCPIDMVWDDKLGCVEIS